MKANDDGWRGKLTDKLDCDGISKGDFFPQRKESYDRYLCSFVGDSFGQKGAAAGVVASAFMSHIGASEDAFAFPSPSPPLVAKRVTRQSVSGKRCPSVISVGEEPDAIGNRETDAITALYYPFDPNEEETRV